MKTASGNKHTDQTNMNFTQKLQIALTLLSEDIATRWISPDELYGMTGSTPFIFNKDGAIHYGKNDQDKHSEIVRRNKDYYGLSHGLGMQVIHFLKKLESGADALVGRAGFFGTDAPVYLVTFWNTDQKAYDQLLMQCLAKLDDDGVTADDYYVSSPTLNTIKAEELGSSEQHEADLENVELLKQLHLMPSGAKRAAMKKLGLAVGSKPHEWEAAMKQHGLLQPGQKWWATQSESRG